MKRSFNLPIVLRWAGNCFYRQRKKIRRQGSPTQPGPGVGTPPRAGAGLDVSLLWVTGLDTAASGPLALREVGAPHVFSGQDGGAGYNHGGGDRHCWFCECELCLEGGEPRQLRPCPGQWHLRALCTPRARAPVELLVRPHPWVRSRRRLCVGLRVCFPCRGVRCGACGLKPGAQQPRPSSTCLLCR